MPVSDVIHPARACALMLAMAGSTTALAQFGGPGSTLPAVPFPEQNDFSEAKRILGKILFWDEQLSSDATMACATCHMPASGGADPRLAVHPGPDGILGTGDDLMTSPGVIAADAADKYQPDPAFGLDPQLTPRAANPAILAMYAESLFWDGRAATEFLDPETGEVVIASGGALESQAVGPIVSGIEMAHADRDWTEVTAKLETAVPLALATNLTDDMADALATEPAYPDLFEDAFGDATISAARIGMAIATYERTLLPDQTPWDAFMQGDNNAMTPQQRQGWNVFQGSNCQACHVPPLFTDNTFRNIGLRPNNQDLGRGDVTGNPNDNGRFKTPTLRNTGLKRTLMHTGQFDTVGQVFPFYAGPGAPGVPNRDPLLPAPVPPPAVPAVVDFIVNALTDARVANETFPFDRPTLHSQRAPNPEITGFGTTGSGGLRPRMIAAAPPYVGNEWFKVGVDRALAGATAECVWSSSPPSGGVVPADGSSGTITLEGLGIGNGFATFLWPIEADPALEGQTVFMQWRIDDPSAAGGVALSPVAEITFLCGSRCPDSTACPADLAEPIGVLDLSDIQAFVAAFTSGGEIADLAEPFGVLDLGDLAAFVAAFTGGCGL